MAGFGSLLGSLAGGLTDLAQGQNIGGMAQKAKTTWGNQSTLTKGAIAGGLLGVLLSGNARKLVGTGVEVGGAALIGGLAMKAFSDWQAGKQVAAQASAQAIPAPANTSFLPTDPAAAEDLSHRLLQAMVAATKADGVVTPQERAAITAHLADLGLGPEAEAMILQQLDTPLDIGQVAALAQTPQEAAGVYTASLLVINRAGAAEQGYLAMLAARLHLDPTLVAHLEANVPMAA